MSLPTIVLHRVLNLGEGDDMDTHLNPDPHLLDLQMALHRLRLVLGVHSQILRLAIAPVLIELGSALNRCEGNRDNKHLPDTQEALVVVHGQILQLAAATGRINLVLLAPQIVFRPGHAIAFMMRPIHPVTALRHYRLEEVQIFLS